MVGVHHGNSYIARYFDMQETVIRDSVRVLKKYADDYDLLVCTGTSGLIITPVLAWRLKKPFAVVRKPDQSRNAGSNLIEGTVVNGQRYVWIDDFISSGETRDRVVAAMVQLGDVKGVRTTKVGQLLWNDGRLELNGKRHKL